MTLTAQMTLRCSLSLSGNRSSLMNLTCMLRINTQCPRTERDLIMTLLLLLGSQI